VIEFAALTGPLPKAGVVAVAVLAAAALLAPTDRQRAVAVLGALVVSPVLLAADIWHSPQLHFVHRHPLVAVALVLLAVALVAAAAVVIDRWPAVLGALAIVALPFRVSIQSGGVTNNLLVPLYFVIAAGSLAFAVRALRGGDPLATKEPRPAGWLERLLALYVVLYALQALYSPTGGLPGTASGFEQALKNIVFFYVPFTLLFSLLVRIEWTPELIRACVRLVAVLAVALAGVAFIEYATKHTFFSSRLAQTNQLYVYFVANSVFFDPNIFGRFLALVMVALAAVLLYDRPRREQLSTSVVLAVLWGALVISFSRTSMLALLVGLAILAALRWRPGAALVTGAVIVAVGAAAVAASPTTFGLNQGLNGVSAGRGSVLSGAIHLFGDRPVWGFGSGSFELEYRSHNLGTGGPLTASHTTPLTIAAEQGLIGELAYAALIVVAIAVLARGARESPVRAAIAAAFAALLVHTMLYADFLEDPFTWALLGVGAALARASPVGALRPVYGTSAGAPIPSHAGSASGAIAHASASRPSTLS
jgi:putative inorganic carbon (HCO3(-)) transporter